MRKINDININTRTYWDDCYGDKQKRMEYASQGTCNSGIIDVGSMLIRPTSRFTRTLEEIKDWDKVLDIGCGVGVFTNLVQKKYKNCEVWGTDISKKAIIDNIIENPSIHYFYQHIGNQTALPNNYFDVVFSGEVLEHLDTPDLLLKDAFNALKKGGKLIITTPDGLSIQSDEHVWAYTHDDVNKLYIDNGFTAPEFIYLPNMESVMVIYAIGRKV